MGFSNKAKNIITGLFGIAFMLIGVVMFVLLVIDEIPKDFDVSIYIWLVPFIPVLIGMTILHVPEIIIKMFIGYVIKKTEK